MATAAALPPVSVDALFRSEARPARSRSLIGLCLVLGILIDAQLFFKIKMENGKVLSNIQVDEDNYSKPLKLLLPIKYKEGGYVRWSTTGLAVTSKLNEWWTAEATIYALSALLTVVSFVCSWLAFRSAVFTLFFTSIMAFGPQFNYAWINGSCSVYYLFVSYAVVNLLSLYYLLAKPDEHPRRARWSFVLSLLALALCWETWLDYFVFLSMLAALGYVWLVRHPAPRVRRSLDFMTLSTLCVAVPYLVVRIVYGGNHNQPGSECELITRHKHGILMVEDFVSNVFTYLYISFMNFIPHWLLASNSLACLSDKELIASQNGYHAACQHYVPMHYHYFWHFQAGMLVLAFFHSFIRLLVRGWREPTVHRCVLFALCLLILTGFCTHSLIKFRPYLSLPLLSYKATLSILGAACLISYLAMLGWSRWSHSWKGHWVLGGGALVLMVTFLTHPSWQAKMQPKVGLSAPPDPLQFFERRAHR